MIADFLLIALLSLQESEPPKLPEPEDEYVYCWLSINRDEDGRLIGFTEDCND